MPVATATADPPLDPPQVRSGAKGLPVAPNKGFRVLAPMLFSGTLVLPITTAPARLIRATIGESSEALASFSSGLPQVVAKPATSWMSFMATGKPCKGPGVAPCASSLSSRRAVSLAREKSGITKALTTGSRRCALATQLATRASDVCSPDTRALCASSADICCASLIPFPPHKNALVCESR